MVVSNHKQLHWRSCTQDRVKATKRFSAIRSTGNPYLTLRSSRKKFFMRSSWCRAPCPVEHRSPHEHTRQSLIGACKLGRHLGLRQSGYGSIDVMDLLVAHAADLLLIILDRTTALMETNIGQGTDQAVGPVEILRTSREPACRHSTRAWSRHWRTAARAR